MIKMYDIYTMDLLVHQLLKLINCFNSTVNTNTEILQNKTKQNKKTIGNDLSFFLKKWRTMHCEHF